MPADGRPYPRRLNDPLSSSAPDAAVGHAESATPSRLIVVAPPGSSAERLLGLVALGDIGDIRPSVDSALEACQGHAH